MPDRNSLTHEATALARDVKVAARVTAGSAAALWAIEIADWAFFSGGLDRFGVAPRTIAGLLGIVTMPFLHAGFGHLLANTLMGVPLAFLSMSRKKADFAAVAVVSAVTAGLGAWLFGATGSVHVGASGVIFGLLGFLLARGWYERSVSAVLLSLFVGMMYGGALWGVLPTVASGISWQAHLFGFIGGVWCARTVARGKKRR